MQRWNNEPTQAKGTAPFLTSKLDIWKDHEQPATSAINFDGAWSVKNILKMHKPPKPGKP